MIRNFDRIEVEFFNKKTMESENFTAFSQQDMDIINKKYSEEKYQGQEWKMNKSGIVKCSCGQEVSCDSFTNTCRCGADYNFSGTRLAPRSQWGEETGEHWTDCY
jgi:glycyl-tRNA synthetase (class II)